MPSFPRRIAAHEARALRASVVVAAVVACVGCSSDPARVREGEPVGRAAAPLQHAQDDAAHSFAVGVCGAGGPGSCSLTCSGVLIAPSVVVTARHCVDLTNDKVDCATARFTGRRGAADAIWITTDESMHQAASGWHRVASVVTPSAGEVCGNDLALLVLADVVTPAEATPAAPAVRYPLTNHTVYRFASTVFGYGVTAPPPASGPAPTPDTAGYRRRKTDVPLVCIPDDPDPAADCCHLDPRTAGALAENELEAGDGTCEGDSGAGAFDPGSVDAGKPVVLGVLSRGGVDDTGLDCVGSIYTRLDRWRDLLVQTAKDAASAGRYDAPSWTLAAAAGTEGCFTPPRGSSALLACVGTTGSGAADAGAADDCPDGPLCRARICAGTAAPANAATASDGGACTVRSAGIPRGRSLAWFAAVFGLLGAARRRRRERGARG